MVKTFVIFQLNFALRQCLIMWEDGYLQKWKRGKDPYCTCFIMLNENDFDQSSIWMIYESNEINGVV